MKAIFLTFDWIEFSDLLILNKTMREAEVPPILVVPVPATMVETIFKLFRLPLKLLGILLSNQKSFSSKNLPVRRKFRNLYLMSFTHWVMWKLMIIVWHWIEVDVKSKRKRRIIVTTVEWTMIQVGSFLLFHFVSWFKHWLILTLKGSNITLPWNNLLCICIKLGK